jgi:hypothetical protein
MYLFTRTARLAPGSIRESLAWAADITDRVNRIGVVEAELWQRTMSPGLGTLVWSTVVPDLVTLETAQAKLESDDSYLDAVDRGAQFIDDTGVDDLLATVVHGTIDPHRRPEYVSVVTATLTPGSLRSGMAVGIEIAERASALCGESTSFCLASSGRFGQVAWLTGYASIEAMDRGEQAIYADAAFVEVLDGAASTAYEDGEASFLRRLV